MKVVVFDLDRTLGYFHCLVNIPKAPQPANKLYHLASELANIPECPILRPGIIGVLRYVYAARIMKQVSHIILYSNNPNTNLVSIAVMLIELELGLTTEGPLFDFVLDANTEIRKQHDTFKVSPNDAGKTMNTIRVLIPAISPMNVIFIDDHPNHPIKDSISDGLSYIIPTPYSFVMTPDLTNSIKEILQKYGYDIYIRAPESSYTTDHALLFDEIIRQINKP